MKTVVLSAITAASRYSATTASLSLTLLMSIFELS